MTGSRVSPAILACRFLSELKQTPKKRFRSGTSAASLDL
jgi:hypothetical protein